MIRNICDCCGFYAITSTTPCRVRIPFSKGTAITKDVHLCSACHKELVAAETEALCADLKRHFSKFSDEVYKVAISKGYFDGHRAGEYAGVSAILEEVQEVLDAMVKDDPASEVIDAGSVAEELSDVFLTLLSHCRHHGIDLLGTAIKKFTYNKKRPHTNERN